MTHRIIVKSLKCGNSAETIRESLSKVKGVTAIDFFMAENTVCIQGESIAVKEIRGAMNSMQYQERGQEGIFTKKNSYENWYCYSCSDCDA